MTTKEKASRWEAFLVSLEIIEYEACPVMTDRSGCFPYGRFDDLAGFQAGGADADALIGAIHAGAHWTQVHVPAAAAHVVSVADLVSKLRAFAADVANLCHCIDSQMS
jgi:hypothetical protein